MRNFTTQIDLRRIDLNLLVTLDALLAEHNVTRAAARLHLAQPTVSVQLARLREVFEDPLLLPGPRGMRPTARAESLREPLRLALQALASAVAPAPAFDPAHASQVWRAAASDYSASTILWPAMAALRARAPGTQLAVLQVVPGHIGKLAEQGHIDLAFHIAEDAPQGLRSRALFSDRYVLAGRAGHPGLRRRPSLAQFRKLEHAIVSPDGGGFHGVTDLALAQRGLVRRVAVSVPSFLLLASVLAVTDLVAMIPRRLVQGNPALRIVEAPVAVPGFEMLMLWHEQVHRDPGHQWLREQIAQAV
ncbi:LysR family transcriptional regulator [Orrella dioscoreae]|uniref:Transcriptional regulator n=1 Tax=Orrella dioscoreae TaxID=1851544 RepID=A0A1C3K2K4_9BURK|nr:LysR family transcriptional regulator [Orrella dioscoreae]SBT25736.1 Transcriptional regulator [Orrella dioscoreae]SOE52076.1 Transcriptional regulator [Orrella dioscoreae]